MGTAKIPLAWFLSSELWPTAAKHRLNVHDLPHTVSSTFAALAHYPRDSPVFSALFYNWSTWSSEPTHRNNSSWRHCFNPLNMAGLWHQNCALTSRLTCSRSVHHSGLELRVYPVWSESRPWEVVMCSGASRSLGSPVFSAPSPKTARQGLGWMLDLPPGLGWE